MQKKLIALAIVAAFSTPAFAEVTVYGQVHASVDANSGNKGETTTTGTKNGLNVTSNASRIGFKGAEDLAGGLKGVFQIETQVNAGTSTNFSTARDTYIGVAGGFGTLIAGRLPLANQYANDANFFGAKVGDAGNFTAGGFGGAGLLAIPSRVDRAIAYVSPSLGGVTVLAAFVPNTQQSLGAAQDSLNKQSSYTLRASYDSNGIFAAANLASIGVAGVNMVTNAAAAGLGANAVANQTGVAGKDGKVTIVSLAGGYDFGVAKIRAQLVQSKADAAATSGWYNNLPPITVGLPGVEAKQTVIGVAGQFKLSEDDSISAEVFKAQDLKLAGNSAANTGATLIAVGYDHAMSKNTTAYVAFAKVNNSTAASFGATGYAHGGVGTDAAAGGVSYSQSALSLGMIRNF